MNCQTCIKADVCTYLRKELEYQSSTSFVPHWVSQEAGEVRERVGAYLGKDCPHYLRRPG